MSKEPTGGLSEQAYEWIIRAAVLVMITVAVKAVANVYMAYSNLYCNDSTWYYYHQAPAVVCSASDLYWNYLVAVAVFIGAIAIAMYADFKRYYWYYEVTKGKIVGFPHTSSLFGEEYYVTIYGRRRDDTLGRTRHRVSPKTYFDTQVGRYIDFS